MKGIDIQIESLRSYFEDLLFNGFDTIFYGRCMRNYRDGMIPEVLKSGAKEYTEVLLNDRFDVLSFFDVESARTLNEATVNIYFAVNLSVIYSTVNERATEYALSEIVMLIKRHGLFEITGITDGYESWKDWDKVKKEDNMQPYYLFRIETKVTYNLICS